MLNARGCGSSRKRGEDTRHLLIGSSSLSQPIHPKRLRLRMSLSIAPATSADLPRLATIQRRAFAPSRINQVIFGRVTPADFDSHACIRLQSAIDDEKQAVWKAVLNDEVVGFALWGVPHDYEDEQVTKNEEESDEAKREKREKKFPPGTDYELAASFFDSLDLGIKVPHHRGSSRSVVLSPFSLRLLRAHRLEHSRRRPCRTTYRSWLCAFTLGLPKGGHGGGRRLSRSD
jgi:hypothetical protein